MNLFIPDDGAAAEVLGMALDALDDAELGQHIAIAVGLLAHRKGDTFATDLACRIACALPGARGTA